MSGSNSSAPASAPAEALSFAVHSLPAPELPEARRTRLGRLKMLLVLAICAAPVAASYFTYFVVRPEGRAAYGELITPPRPLPEALPLADLDGRPVPAASLKGQWLLAVVAGGDCDAACEKALFAQRQLHEALGREKTRVDKVWFVDDAAPLRPALRQALAADTPARVLRVPPAALAGWLAPAGGQALASHLYLVDPMGQWMMRAPAQPALAPLKRDLERLLRAAASWDEPGR